jgi:prophage antirepressor-like protein
MQNNNFLMDQWETVVVNGEKCVTVAALAEALDHKDRRELIRLIRRHADEFEEKVFRINLTTIKGERLCRVVNPRGIIRIAMLSRAPKARVFRDKAEGILFKVMTTGFYVDPSL